LSFPYKYCSLSDAHNFLAVNLLLVLRYPEVVSKSIYFSHFWEISQTKWEITQTRLNGSGWILGLAKRGSRNGRGWVGHLGRSPTLCLRCVYLVVSQIMRSRVRKRAALDLWGSATIGSAPMHVTAEQMANSADTLQAEQKGCEQSVTHHTYPPDAPAI
jgi:hypothetical protein